MERLKINDKYEIIENLESGEFKCLRYGEEWRDLVGDNMVLAMFYRIKELEEKLNKLRNIQDLGVIEFEDELKD